MNNERPGGRGARLAPAVVSAGVVTRQLQHVWELSRPWALVSIVGLVASVQIAVSGGSLRWTYLLLSSVGVACAVFGGFAVNDFFDRSIDKTAHRERPIPSGRMKARTVLCLALLAFVASGTVFWFLGGTARVVGMSAIILLLAYTPFKNAFGLLGNIAVSFIVALAVVYGILTGRSSSAVDSSFLLVAASAFFGLLSREFAKDVEDMDSDRAGGRRRTIPLLRGPTTAFQFSAAALTVALLLLLTFLLMGERYLGLFLALPLAGYGAFVVVKLLKATPTPDGAKPLVLHLKIGFLLTLVVLIASFYDRALW